MTYTAVVLDDKSHARLVEIFGPTWEDERGWETIAHHMTMNMGNIKPGWQHWLGKTVSLKVVAYAGNNKVKAVQVETSVPTDNKIAHVTLAVNRGNGGKPVMSNQLTNWSPVKNEIYLSGVVEEVT